MLCIYFLFASSGSGGLENFWSLSAGENEAFVQVSEVSEVYHECVYVSQWQFVSRKKNPTTVKCCLLFLKNRRSLLYIGV